jgi:hypothetical protein
MKTLKARLQAAGIDPSSLQPWYEAGDERGFRLTVPEDADETWRALRRLVEKTGFWPVILGEQEEMERVAVGAAENSWGSTKALIEKSLVTAGEAHLERAFEDFLRNQREYMDHPMVPIPEEEVRALEAALASDDPFRCMPRGEWPEDVWPGNSFSTPYDFTGEPWPEVFIGLVPTKESWQVPIYLQFGGFNACPHPDVHGAVLRYWQEKYGAEVACVQSDTLELNVARPPQGREEALRLAREMYLFCQDIVEQGTRTLEWLAAEKALDSTTWFFWWD